MFRNSIIFQLSQSGFDTGGRQIEVKVITATGLPFGKKSKIFGSKSLNGAGGGNIKYTILSILNFVISNDENMGFTTISCLKIIV